jgi:hypothetical protein
MGYCKFGGSAPRSEAFSGEDIAFLEAAAPITNGLKTAQLISRETTHCLSAGQGVLGSFSWT